MHISLEEAFRKIAELSTSEMRSEEDVKIKIVLPFLRALGYDDGDFSYEAKTGRGYVDIVVDRFPNILRLLRERGAVSKQTAVQRSWLDDQLIGKIDRIPTKQEVSWGLIELKQKSLIDYEKQRGAIDSVWLVEM